MVLHRELQHRPWKLHHTAEAAELTDPSLTLRETDVPKAYTKCLQVSLLCPSLSQPLARTSEEQGSCPALPAPLGPWAVTGCAAANSISHLYFIFAE